MDDENDLIDINEIITETEETSSIQETQTNIINKMKEENLINDEINKAILDPKSEGFISIIKDNVSFCVDELKDVNMTMEKISNQGNAEMFFKKGENIKLLSQYMSKMANVNQKTLDLLILLLGASGKISDEYDTILTTIDELGNLNKGETEVLNYLLKVKKMVFEIRDNDTRLKEVIETCNNSRELVEKANERIEKELNENEKSRKVINSKCNRLQKRISQNNLYIGICLIIIIALSIFVGVKFYVF